MAKTVGNYLVVNADFETGRTPVNKLDGSFSLNLSDSSIDVLSRVIIFLRKSVTIGLIVVNIYITVIYYNPPLERRHLGTTCNTPYTFRYEGHI